MLLTSYNHLYTSGDDGATWTFAVEMPLWSSLGAPRSTRAPDRVVLPFTGGRHPVPRHRPPPIYPTGVLPWAVVERHRSLSVTAVAPA